jgi:prepilin-type N-terminal cleavage/methylation domain-containing protein
MNASAENRKQPLSAVSRSAFTLAELIVTIGIIGLLSAIAIPIYQNVRYASEEAVATDLVESLNHAVTKYSQECWKIPTLADASATTDEYAVLRSLQYRFPSASLKPGSPFFNPTYDPKTSSNTSELRIRWNGKSFELLKHGQSGTGLKYDNGNDVKNTPYNFPSDYKPEGAS